MPDLGIVSLSASLTLTTCPNFKSLADPSDQGSVKTLGVDCDWDRGLRLPTLHNGEVSNGHAIRVFRRSRPLAGPSKKASNGKSLEDHVRDWVSTRVELGIPECRCSLPFLYGAKKLVECLVCHNFAYPGEEVSCSVRGCQGVYHRKCVKDRYCVIKEITVMEGTMATSIVAIRLVDRTNLFVDEQHAASISSIEEVFCCLPLPYTAEEFKIDLAWKDTDIKIEPPPYLHIRRNIYLVKKKRDNVGDDVGCTCISICSQDCVCRGQCISCSKDCHCSENCTNRPFRKEKRLKIVKTEHCGWGAEAAESVKKGDFIIEYVGEVIDDALCEKRLWDMKYKEVNNFYMCEIRKDFTIDATFKGNPSRFLNHSCDPNCVLEKWQVEGETRVGVFAARSIQVGEPLTYDYRFVQFGPEVECRCGASNCQRFLGTKRKMGKTLSLPSHNACPYISPKLHELQPLPP
ncbi:histone-lysine N-methyltransferase ASHR3 [Pyrus ussuriensis x Pyrus communis]|uniref:Histone-lysine N-methyltransferase ASHR3 n=1 Tax=Pyrus ussuriensis x Pyrus communis TaxID=2448454 RepID=A0A5N5HD75_9ROSA|nr:histone-lysine N-methyltransferase ASHR3 [Pyrus ussuriensis x Pyrus communis]